VGHLLKSVVAALFLQCIKFSNPVAIADGHELACLLWMESLLEASLVVLFVQCATC